MTGAESALVCLYTDSHEPSGVGEHMLTLASQLVRRYRVLFACLGTRAGPHLLERARHIGCETLTTSSDETTFEQLLIAKQASVFHVHAGIAWEGQNGISQARRAGVNAIIRTEHLPYLLTDARQQEEHRASIQLADRVICVSHGVRRSYLKAGFSAHKVVTVRNGITVRPARNAGTMIRAHLGISSECKLALTVARFSHQKGYSFLLNAVPRVVATHPHVRFVWVGSGPLQPDLERLVQDRGLRERVLFLGHRVDVPDLMTAADVFVLPSLFEGLPLVLLEAMAAGVPIVATGVCGTSEVIRDRCSGRLIPSADDDAIARAIIEVLDNPELAARWAAEARKSVERDFNAARMAEETAAIYEDVLRSARTGTTQSAGRFA